MTPATFGAEVNACTIRHVILQFEYTIDDFREAYGARSSKPLSSRWITVGLPVAGGLLIGVLTLFFDPSTTWFVPMGVLLLVMLVALIVLRRKVGPATVLQSIPALRGPMVADVDVERVVLASAIWRVECRWPAIVRFAETPRLFLLYTGPITFHVFPKRGCASQEELDAFRNLARNRIPTTP